MDVCAMNFSFMLQFQINLIQGDDGTAEINPDEYFNNILRSLRDAIDGNCSSTCDIYA